MDDRTRHDDGSINFNGEMSRIFNSDASWAVKNAMLAELAADLLAETVAINRETVEKMAALAAPRGVVEHATRGQVSEPIVATSDAAAIFELVASAGGRLTRDDSARNTGGEHGEA